MFGGLPAISSKTSMRPLVERMLSRNDFVELSGGLAFDEVGAIDMKGMVGERSLC